MLSTAAAALSFAPTAPVSAPVLSSARSVAPVMETKADLEALAKKLNPVVGFWCAPPDTRPAACTARGTGPVVAPAAA